jgi:outer membrane autotransporter protein
MFRIGAAFNLGGGYAKSSGDFNTSDNRFTFWGVNLYGGWAMDNFGVSIDGGYTGTYNELRQDVPAAMNMAQLKGDVNGDAWHAGLRAEYRFETQMLDIIPHAGVRWSSVHMNSYKVKSGGGTVFKVDESYQSIWTFPLGVSFAKSFSNASGWSFRPQLDAGVIPAAGDVKSTSRVKVPGVAGAADLKVQQVDYLTFDGTAGFEVANGQGFSIGINYNLQLSEHRTGHGVYGTLRYEF